MSKRKERLTDPYISGYLQSFLARFIANQSSPLCSYLNLGSLLRPNLTTFFIWIVAPLYNIHYIPEHSYSACRPTSFRAKHAAIYIWIIFLSKICIVIVLAAAIDAVYIVCVLSCMCIVPKALLSQKEKQWPQKRGGYPSFFFILIIFRRDGWIDPRI